VTHVLNQERKAWEIKGGLNYHAAGWRGKEQKKSKKSSPQKQRRTPTSATRKYYSQGESINDQPPQEKRDGASKYVRRGTKASPNNSDAASRCDRRKKGRISQENVLNQAATWRTRGPKGRKSGQTVGAVGTPKKNQGNGRIEGEGEEDKT